MIYRSRHNFIATLFFGILFCIPLFLDETIWRIIGLGLILTLVYNVKENQITEEGVSQNRFIVFKKVFFPFEKIDKVICPCIPELLKNLDVSNRLLFYAGKDCIVFKSVFSDSKEDLANIKRILCFLESKGVKVYLLVPSGEEKKQMFTGFEVIKRLPDEPLIWF